MLRQHPSVNTFELRELWEDSDSFDAWLASVKNLKGRIRT